MPKKVLIVEDEEAIVEILKFNLQREGYETMVAMDGELGLHLAKTGDPDLILLDLMLPKLNGFEVCSALRGAGNSVPIIMVTAREEEADKVMGLETGADDYITKPFSMRELMARVKANMRRHNLETGTPVTRTLGGLTVDDANYVATKNGVDLELTQKEFELLRLLMSTPNKVYTREELMEKVWNYDYYGDTRTVDVMVRRLREKIEDDPGQPARIMTRRGVGYYFAED